MFGGGAALGIEAYDEEYPTFAFPNDRFSIVSAWVNKKIMPQRHNKTAKDRKIDCHSGDF